MKQREQLSSSRQANCNCECWYISAARAAGGQELSHQVSKPKSQGRPLAERCMARAASRAGLRAWRACCCGSLPSQQASTRATMTVMSSSFPPLSLPSSRRPSFQEAVESCTQGLAKAERAVSTLGQQPLTPAAACQGL